jgi:hypothetical protein
MWDLLAYSQASINLGIKRTELALFGEHIKDSFWFSTGNAQFSIEVGELKRTVGDVIILHAALVVFFDEVINGLAAQYPVGGVDIALEDGGAEDDGGGALGVDCLLDTVQ